MMTALSVTAPWAWAIFHAQKDIENRTWPWSKKIPLPKRLLIHASKDITRDEYMFAVECIWQIAHIDTPAINELPRGAIIGAVTVTGCVTTSSSLWFGGPYGFELTQPVALPRVVRCRGQLGLWTVSNDIEAEVRAAAKEIAA